MATTVRPCELDVEGQIGVKTGCGRPWVGHSFGEVTSVRTPRPGISFWVVSGRRGGALGQGALGRQGPWEEKGQAWGEAEGLKQGMLGGLWGVSVKETLGSVVCVAEQTLRLLPESHFTAL